MTPQMARHPEEAAIRSEMEAIADAVRAKDVDAFLSRCSPEIVVYDLLPPLEHVGMAAVRRNWADALGRFQGSADFEVRDLDIAVDGDVAFCRTLARFGGMLKSGTRVHTWLRSTFGFRRTNGRWKIVHQHASVPIDMKSGMGLTGLEPA
ncbi:MAG TPA: nuclear transport factor 2 family protein [Candidatus Eisenbacteria bacterium]|nr:nuclear transport factor 2 family protein [Candidatus Eisenbacteria bacterium]